MGKSFKRLWKVGRVDDCSSFENCSFARCDAGGSNPSPSSNIWKINGSVAERFIAAVLKTVELWRAVPWVRIPPLPPNRIEKNYGVLSLIGKALNCELRRYGFKSRRTPQNMVDWLSGLKHFPAKEASMKYGSEGSNPSSTAKLNGRLAERTNATSWKVVRLH